MRGEICGQTFGNAGLAVELTKERREVKHVEHTCEEIIGAWGRDEGGRGAECVRE
jgi:hypothetical protein